MLSIPGQLAIKTIHGRNGDFNVGLLSTAIGDFVVKDADLDQYSEGKYDGDFLVDRIRPHSYFHNARLVVEVRAELSGMTLSSADALSRDEAGQMSPQEVDPVDEVAPAATPVQPAPADDAKPRSPKHPLVDTTPFGSEPPVASAQDSDEAADAALFETLWPLGDVVKLDSTVDRRKLRQQRDRLDELGYEFDPMTQKWCLASFA